VPEVTFPIDAGINSRGTGDTGVDITSAGVAVAGTSNNVLATTVPLATNGKAATTSDGWLKFDTSAIPSGVTINSAKITFTSNQTGSVAAPPQVKILGLDPSEIWSESSVTDHTDDANGMLCKLTTTGAVDAAEGRALTSTGHFTMTPNGGATNHCQVMRNTASGTLGSATIKVGRAGNATAAAEEGWVEIWSVTGSSGSYKPLTKLAESVHVGWNSINVSIVDQTFTFTGANQITMPGVGGALWILRLNQNFTPQEPLGAFNRLFYKVPWGNAQGSFTPSIHNGIRQGTYSGFTTQLYPKGQHVHNIALLGSETPFYTSQMIAGSSYSWGSSSMTPSISTDHVKNSVANVIADAGYNGSVGMRLLTTFVSGFVGYSRVMRSYNHASDPGPTLTVNWTVPSVSVSIDPDITFSANTSADFLASVGIDPDITFSANTSADFLASVGIDPSIDITASTTAEYLLRVAAAANITINAATAAELFAKISASSSIVLDAATAAALFEACLITLSATQPGDDADTAVQPGGDTITATQPGDDTVTTTQPGDDTITAVEPDDDTITASSGCE
jgi:hypothetical protein